jgi:hypothetical protein
LRYRFDEFSLDTDRRELRRADVLVSVEPQVFGVLTYLVCQRDRVVTKNELLTAVWNGRFVSESALTTRMNAARSAVNDSGEALADDILPALSRVRGLFVSARQPSFPSKPDRGRETDRPRARHTLRGRGQRSKNQRSRSHHRAAD